VDTDTPAILQRGESVNPYGGSASMRLNRRCSCCTGRRSRDGLNLAEPVLVGYLVGPPLDGGAFRPRRCGHSRGRRGSGGGRLSSVGRRFRRRRCASGRVGLQVRPASSSAMVISIVIAALLIGLLGSRAAERSVASCAVSFSTVWRSYQRCQHLQRVPGP
jgi:hypothetical protein